MRRAGPAIMPVERSVVGKAPRRGHQRHPGAAGPATGTRQGRPESHDGGTRRTAGDVRGGHPPVPEAAQGRRVSGRVVGHETIADPAHCEEPGLHALPHRRRMDQDTHAGADRGMDFDYADVRIMPTVPRVALPGGGSTLAQTWLAGFRSHLLGWRSKSG